ncbi:COG4315 family predicted lipoprotein [Roseateles amylovorans]|uniref:Lipoprotein with Yx(FWY)xxD motif n=1 Tax=Roseateles amylovorans TaxID=2978473 RepID=A0ABY6B1X7_9BURK|nr:hypothetical protein [Roseateles amylovorans]UXH77300.1 hypothetical protein N4261_20150 [Roseateles amylovorans]
MKTSLRLIAATSLLAAASLACAQQAPAMAKDGALVGPNEMTLYTFDKDTAGKSACNGPCAKNWPPLVAKADDKPAGEWTLITRDDGAKQWAYKGKPLYFWVKDTKPGDRTGDGVNQVWHTAKP